jgi:hypothetical protein
VSAEADISPLAVAAAEDALRALAKAQRAMQMYLANNPTRAHALDAARAAFKRLWEFESSLELVVRESAFTWHEQPVFRETERVNDGLPWLVYRDGIRLLTFSEGFETHSLDTLLSIFQRARGANDDDDLVTLLWVADLEGVSYRHVEVDAGSEDHHDSLSRWSDGDGSVSGAEPLAVASAESAAHWSDATTGLIQPDDFESTLYFLDANEVQYLDDQLTIEHTTNQRQRAFGMLLDIVELPIADADKLRALAHIDQLLLECLASNDYEQVGYVLREAVVTLRRGEHSALIAGALRELPSRLSEPAVIGQMLQALDDARTEHHIALLEALVMELHPVALAPLATWLGVHSDSPARQAVEHAALRLAGGHTAALAQVLESDHESTVRGALWIAGKLATPAAVPGLSRVLRSPDATLRAAAVHALAGIGSPAALQALERGIDDEQRDVRIATYRAIMARKSAAALPRLAQAVRKKEMRGVDLAEKMILFEAYGTICGAAGVPELDQLLNAKGFLGAKEHPETRACAARALGIIGTPPAVAALQRASDAKDPVVRSAVSRALRGAE